VIIAELAIFPTSEGSSVSRFRQGGIRVIEVRACARDRGMSTTSRRRI